MMNYNQLLKLNDVSNLNKNDTNKMINIDETSLRFAENSGLTEQSQINKMRENLSSNINASSKMTDFNQQSLELKERVSDFLQRPPVENIPSIQLVKNEIFKSYNIEDQLKVIFLLKIYLNLEKRR